MNTNTQTFPQYYGQGSYGEDVDYGSHLHDEATKNDFIKDLFTEEGAFGESDCAGL